MLDVTVRHGDAMITKLQTSWIGSLTISNGPGIAVANISLAKQDGGHGPLYLVVGTRLIENHNKALIKRDIRHPYHLTLPSNAATCSASLPAFISKMSRFSKIPEPMPA